MFLLFPSFPTCFLFHLLIVFLFYFSNNLQLLMFYHKLFSLCFVLFSFPFSPFPSFTFSNLVTVFQKLPHVILLDIDIDIHIHKVEKNEQDINLVYFTGQLQDTRSRTNLTNYRKSVQARASPQRAPEPKGHSRSRREDTQEHPRALGVIVAISAAWRWEKQQGTKQRRLTPKATNGPKTQQLCIL